MKADTSMTGTIVCCPLCSHRVHAWTPRAAWQLMYRHLRDHHDHMRAGQLARNALRMAERSHD